MTSAVLVGLAVSDALGQPFEQRGEGVHKDLPTWDGNYRDGMHHKLPAGHWTDDTEMAVALAQSILRNRGYSQDDAAQAYLRWSKGTPHGMGRTTRKAMQNLAEGVPPHCSGVDFYDKDPETVGNGTAMRVAPIGVWYCNASAELICPIYTAVSQDAEITHQGTEAVAGSLAIAWAVKRSLEGRGGYGLLEDVLERVKGQRGTRVFEQLELAYKLLTQITPPGEAIMKLGRFGNVNQTVATALFCAAWAVDFEQGVCAAVRGGGDTDTRGAIAGAILGARFGLEGIPEKYQKGLLDFEMLHQLDEQLMEGLVA